MQSSNAHAGPSSLPALYLPPKGPPPPRQHLASTQDLLARFQLLPAYDKYVRPYATQYGPDGHIRAAPAGQSPLDKGKGREQDPQTPRAPVGPSPPDAQDHDDDDAAPGSKADKKKKNSYKALIKGVPGKHSMKKDNYLTQAILAPEKQRTRIHPFDLRTQQEAFTVSLEGLKGWNVTTLIVESAQAREDRKKRKELRRLAKAQHAQAAAAMAAVATSTSPTVAQPQPLPAHRGPTAPATHMYHPPSISTTPKPIGTPRPQSSASVLPRPASTAPRPGSTAPSLNMAAIKQEPIPPGMVSTPTSASSDSLRGKKREREDGTTPVNGLSQTAESPYMNGIVNGVGNGNGNGVSKGMNAKAGVAGVRPRPLKKQRMDVQGQARDVSAPVQQPTPQGV